MDLEEPPSKKRKMKNPSKDSPKTKKKLNVKPFALIDNFNDTIEIKKEYESDAQEISTIVSHTANSGNPLTLSSIDENDEVWIVQCPQGINAASLIGENLNFSESCIFKNFSQQYDVETISSPRNLQCILSTENQDGLQLCNIKSSGMLILTDSVLRGTMDIPSSEDSKDTFIHPPNVKLRNPHLLPAELENLTPTSSKKKKSQKC